MDKYAQAFNAGYNNRINEFKKYARGTPFPPPTPEEILARTDRRALSLPEDEYVNATNTATALARAEALNRHGWEEALPRHGWENVELPETMRGEAVDLQREGRQHPDYQALRDLVPWYTRPPATNYLGQTRNLRSRDYDGYVYPLSALTNKSVQAAIPGYTNVLHNLQKRQQAMRNRLPPPAPEPAPAARQSWRERLFGK